jgi:hypothetical protein
VAVALLLALTACGGEGRPPVGQQTPDDRPPRPQGSLVLDFETGPSLGQTVETVTNEGSDPVDVVVATSGVAQVESVEGPDGSRAVRFPAYTGAAVAPAAALVATADDTGALSPLDRDFTFGASFELDEESSGSEADDGDNLVQRGSFGDPGQFKIQLDHGVPSCRIVGDTGEVFVEAGEAVRPGVWYSVSCERDSSEVGLTLTPYDDQDERETWRATGSTGTISFEAQPLSVGGKVTPQGVPVASADQFNGAVDDVFLRIG